MPDQKVLHALPTIIKRLHDKYPDARYELNWETPLQLLVGTILAAQCTDERVNRVTPGLFAKYPDARAYAEADISVLEEDLKPTGFYRQKANTVQSVCKALVEKHGGEVPRSMEAMLELPGVARKSANVVLTNAFQMPTGVIVDTHVHRVSQRMGLTDQKKPEKIEIDLMKHVPKDEWIFFGPAMVLLGRYTCTHYSPNCSDCIVNDLCPKLNLEEEAEGEAEEAAQEPEEVSPTMAAKKAKPTKTSKTAASKTKTTKPAAAKTAPAPTQAIAVPSLRDQLPADWQAALAKELDKPYFKQLEKFVAQERADNTVYPPAEDVFNAFKATPYEQVKVLLLGQDPYHGEGQAHGLSFSVKPGTALPPSLVNIYKELQDDLGHKPVSHGHLTSWTQQGVMLLNTVLTVKANTPGSHKEQGWETFTDAVISALAARAKPVVFLFWGNYAKEKSGLIDAKKHRILLAGHPSPLSAKKFFGSKPFSSANKALQELGQSAITWQLPESPTDAVSAAPVPAAKAALAPTPTPTSKPVAAPTPVKTTPTPVVVPKEEPTHLEGFLPLDWRQALGEEVRKPYFRNLDKYLAGERKDTQICPANEADVFASLAFVRPPGDVLSNRAVRVVILGTEPPCFESVADGLAFSSRDGTDLSETQLTLFKELRQDLGLRLPTTGSLEAWAKQGVLLLNPILTVRSGRPGSHKNQGWETFTDAILKVVNSSPLPVVFALWGRDASKKRSLIDESRHVVITGEHPGITPEKFIGSGMFSAINNALELNGRSAVSWQLPYV